MFKPRAIEILLVEDNPGDIRLTREALIDSRVYNHLSVVIDGIEAMKYLRKEAEYSDVKTPDLILLDLNLPKMDGREVLEEIKKMEDKSDIPIIVLTTSDDEKDIVITRELGASYYITKPAMLENFIDMVQSIEDFWITFVKIDDNDTE